MASGTAAYLTGSLLKPLHFFLNSHVDHIKINAMILEAFLNPQVLWWQVWGLQKAHDDFPSHWCNRIVASNIFSTAHACAQPNCPPPRAFWRPRTQSDQFPSSHVGNCVCVCVGGSRTEQSLVQWGWKSEGTLVERGAAWCNNTI